MYSKACQFCRLNNCIITTGNSAPYRALKINIESLFFRNPNSGFLLFLYAPFGLIIFTLRVFISLIVLILGYVLPSAEIFHKILFKLTCLALGITINVKNPDKKEDVEVYVSNCLSHFDHLAVHGVTGAVMVFCQKNPRAVL